nr:sensor histidine kinase [Bacteroidota bacterium]
MGSQKITIADLSGWNGYLKYRIFIHMAVWFVYTFTFAYIYALFYENITLLRSVTQYSLTAWIDILAAYFTVYYLIPRYLLLRKYKSFFLMFGASAIFLIFLQRVIVGLVSYPLLYPDFDNSSYSFVKFNYAYTFFNIYAMTAIFASVKLFEYWFVNQKQNQELAKEKMESELKFLKSQIHPHFLFNTLNNLYALTLDKSDHAPEVVVKLSDLLSYMLYECNVSLVPLEKEVQLLHDYLGLEKIRYRNELKSQVDIFGRVNGKNIAPLLLLPFVENAFKHGLSKKINEPWINIVLDIEDL